MQIIVSIFIQPKHEQMNLSVKIPVWFWIVAVLLLIWNIMGVIAFYVEINMPSNEEVFPTFSESCKKCTSLNQCGLKLLLAQQCGQDY